MPEEISRRWGALEGLTVEATVTKPLEAKDLVPGTSIKVMMCEIDDRLPQLGYCVSLEEALRALKEAGKEAEAAAIENSLIAPLLSQWGLFFQQGGPVIFEEAA